MTDESTSAFIQTRPVQQQLLGDASFTGTLRKPAGLLTQTHHS